MNISTLHRPDQPGSSTARRTPEHFGVWAFAGLVVVYLAVLQGLGALLTRGLDVGYAAPASINELWRSITVPVGVSVLLGLGVVAALRWWRPVFVDRVPVRRWVVAIPVIMLVTSLLATNYGGLAQRGLAFTALLLVSTLLVGAGEELMFRGLGVTVFRSNGFSEGKVALWSTVIFGLAHATNLFTEGPSAFAQVLVAAGSGYFLYLVRRRTGGIVVPMILHGLWDFSLISAAVVPGKSYGGAGVAMLAILVMATLVVVRRKKIEVAR